MVQTMEKTLVFQAGYYEWLIVHDGKAIYAFGSDISEDIPYPCSREQMKGVVDDLLDCMKLDLKSDDNDNTPEEKSLLLENLDDLREQMIDRLYYEYGEA